MNKFISKRTLTTIVGAGLATVYLLLPATMGVATVFPHQEQVGPPPQGFEQVTLTTADNVALQAWYAPPANGAAIILIHGAGDSRENVRAYAEMLVRHKYGVLALDLRGHGASAGRTNRLGWQGTNDVGAAMAFLQQRAEVKAIGGLGLSLGGEVLLGAASDYPALQAIVADGATRRSLQELFALESERSLYRNFTARVMFATVRLFSGDHPPKPLLDAMHEANSTKFFLIAGAKKTLEVAFNEMFKTTAGERVALWVAPDAGHTEAFSRYPAEYEQRVIEFFDAVLLDYRKNGM